MSYVVAAVSTTEWIRLEKAGSRVFKLPQTIARHFISPLSLEKGQQVVAIRIDADPFDISDVMCAVMAEREQFGD